MSKSSGKEGRISNELLNNAHKRLGPMHISVALRGCYVESFRVYSAVRNSCSSRTLATFNLGQQITCRRGSTDVVDQVTASQSGADYFNRGIHSYPFKIIFAGEILP